MHICVLLCVCVCVCVCVYIYIYIYIYIYTHTNIKIRWLIKIYQNGVIPPPSLTYQFTHKEAVGWCQTQSTGLSALPKYTPYIYLPKTLSLEHYWAGLTWSPDHATLVIAWASIGDNIDIQVGKNSSIKLENISI